MTSTTPSPIMVVAGSPPPSPPPTPPSDTLSDVFGSAPSSPHTSTSLSLPSVSAHQHTGYTDPSDIPRLQAKHETEGYRDGVTKGKAASVQAGFDEGYPLGAAIGMRVGTVLGLLGGCASAVQRARKIRAANSREREGGEEEEAHEVQVEELFRQAERELTIKNVFDAQYWAEDGTWRFEVEEERAGAEGDVVFDHVAKAHPLVRRWENITAELMDLWGVDLTVMDRDEEVESAKEELELGQSAAVELISKPASLARNKGLAW